MSDTPTPLPPPQGYESWLELAMNFIAVNAPPQCEAAARAELARLKRIEDAAKGLLECLSESEKHYIEAEINALSDAIKKP